LSQTSRPWLRRHVELIAGFPCIDWSLLNKNMAMFMDGVRDAFGTSGGVFEQLIAGMSAQGTSIFLGENVGLHSLRCVYIPKFMLCAEHGDCLLVRICPAVGCF